MIGHLFQSHTKKKALKRGVFVLTVIRLGYVAMSLQVKNCSPSQTMTYKTFKSLENKEAAIHRLERIAESNLENCLRLLKHNKAHDIHFFRLSSRLVPLATHEELEGWDYIAALTDKLHEIKDFLQRNPMRIGFHPDHFVLLNSKKIEVLNNSIKNLIMHESLLKGMGIETKHRCVLHVGGGYNDKEKALELFINNWAYVPKHIQDLVILENDDKTFTAKDTLYLCEKLGIPFVFDYHHHLANHEEIDWELDWERAVNTWKYSSVPVKMHISSPKNEKEFRSHADYIDVEMFRDFLKTVKGTVPQIDCMIEAKNKDEALFKLMEDLKRFDDIEVIDQASFKLK